MNVRPEQLDDQRNDRRAGDQIDHGLLLEQAGPHIEVIVFGPVEDGRLVKERNARVDRPPRAIARPSLD